MIYKLILKDIDAYKTTVFVKILLLWLTFSTLVLYRVYTFGFYTVHAVITIIFASSVFSFMEKSQNTEILTCSLPATRKSIVKARYLTTIVIMVSGIIIWLSFAHIVGFISTDPALSLLEVNLEKVLMLIVFSVLIHSSIFLPAVFSFGTIGITMVFVIAFWTSIGTTVYIFQPQFSLNSSFYEFGDFLKISYSLIIAVISYVISFALSSYIYKRRDI